MNYSNEKIDRVYDLFDTSFIYKENELILHKKWNVYFRLDNVESDIHFDYKMLSFCSYYVAENHYGKKTKEYKYFINRLNRWFRKDFKHEELQEIYSKIGCNANTKLGLKFIESGLDMNTLTKKGVPK